MDHPLQPLKAEWHENRHLYRKRQGREANRHWASCRSPSPGVKPPGLREYILAVLSVRAIGAEENASQLPLAEELFLATHSRAPGLGWGSSFVMVEILFAAGDLGRWRGRVPQSKTLSPCHFPKLEYPECS